MKVVLVVGWSKYESGLSCGVV